MTRRATAIILTLLTILIVTTFSSCRSSRAQGDPGAGDTLTHHATLLRLIDHHNGIVSVRVLDPWNDGNTLGTYLLVDRSVPDDSIPDIKDATVIRVPIESALVYSSVHTCGFDELGCIDAVTGIADGMYFTSKKMRNLIDTGKIVDVGNSMSPSLEKIVDLSPDAALVSPYENSGNGILDKTGIAVIEMADYMESTPMGRAEWILLIGALNGKLDKAREIFDNVEKEYTTITKLATATDTRPVVLSELPFNGVWYQPGGKSYASAMIRDAGGRPLLDGNTSTGSVQLDIANVYDRGIDADIWLIKNFGDLSTDDIASTSKLIPHIRAYVNANIWNANTTKTNYFDDIAFHPERILRDMAVIIHPTLSDSLGTPVYYSHIQ